jgi:hypothetical protein
VFSETLDTFFIHLILSSLSCPELNVDQLAWQMKTGNQGHRSLSTHAGITQTGSSFKLRRLNRDVTKVIAGLTLPIYAD